MNLKAIIRLVRPVQWIKNFFIFIPLFFSAKAFDADLDLILQLILAFSGFSLFASSIYVLNDLKDIKADRLHPEKCLRPIASGKISQREAVLIHIILFISAIVVYLFIGNMSAFFLALGYYALNVLYSLYLKHIAIVDVTIVSLGFVFRIVIGGFVAHVDLSHWIVVMVFLLALFLAFAKRRDDVLIFETTGKRMRKNLDGYNRRFLDSCMVIMASVIIVAYLLYCTSPEVIARSSSNLYITALFVVMGIIRYLQIALVKERSGNPTRILVKDYFIQGCIFAWLLTFFIILY